MTALDAIGRYEVLHQVPSLDVVFVGEARGEVRTESGRLGLTVAATFEEVPAPDVIVVPGGIGTRAVLEGARSSIGCGARTTALDSQPRCAAAH